MTEPQLDIWQDKTVPCADSECDGQGEPDGDNELKYYTCDNCGYEFGYQRIPQTVISEDQAGNCSVGIPEEVRRRASVPMELALREQQRREAGPVPLQIGFGPPKE